MDEYLAVQEKMHKKGKNKSNGQESLFAHLAVCADCGKGMVFRSDRRNGAYVCGGYVKHSRTFCSSHIIEADSLLQMVKTDLRELISNSVKLDKLYHAVQGKMSQQQSGQLRELQRVNKRIAQLTSEFQALFQLYAGQAITMEQFTAQNQHLQEEQSRLVQRKAELEMSLETQKDTEKQFRAFKSQITKFAQLDIEDEQVLKQLLQQVIHKIEVHEGGSILIHYNITQPAIKAYKQGA